jgi:hypothetical protein
MRRVTPEVHRQVRTEAVPDVDAVDDQWLNAEPVHHMNGCTRTGRLNAMTQDKREGFASMRSVTRWLHMSVDSAVTVFKI